MDDTIWDAFGDELEKIAWWPRGIGALGAMTGAGTAAQGKSSKDSPGVGRILAGGGVGTVTGYAGGVAGSLLPIIAASLLRNKKLGPTAAGMLATGGGTVGSLYGGMLGGKLVRRLAKERPYTAKEKRRNLKVLKQLHASEGKAGKKIMRKALRKSKLDYEQDFLKQIEREKVAASGGLSRAAAVLLGTTALGAGVGGGLWLGMGKDTRNKIREEIRDPRLKHNLKGMATFKSKKQRVAGHAALLKKHRRS